MTINLKQKRYLSTLLKQNKLNKEIDTLTQKEASILIEGLLNNGTVKDTFNNKKLSRETIDKKQRLFDSLIEAKIFLATEKQMNLIKKLCLTNGYILSKNNLTAIEANYVIKYFTNNLKSSIALALITKTDNNHLIRTKKVSCDIQLDFPEEWILYSVDINGVINFNQ